MDFASNASPSPRSVLILGGGISGLSAAYFLSKKGGYTITVLDKKEEGGGCISSSQVGDFFFEAGPRTFRTGKCPELSTLIEELGLQGEVITSDPAQRGKYVFLKGKLRKVPFFSWGLVRALLTEWAVKRGSLDDESIWDFAARRFNKEVAGHFFDPLALGIYARDAKTLSVKSCFPFLHAWEQEYGSITRALLYQKRSKSSSLFTLRGGLQQLVRALEEASGATLRYGEEALSLSCSEGGILVKTTKGEERADWVISALPAHEIGKLTASEFQDAAMTDLTVVNLGYKEPLLHKKGFGYLVPTSEGEEILGVVFDSNIFPQQNGAPSETRLTVMLKSSERAYERALFAVRRHLGIVAEPDAYRVTDWRSAFPQMRVGYGALLSAFQEEVGRKFPRLHLVGNYLEGASVNDCVKRVISSFGRGWDGSLR